MHDGWGDLEPGDLVPTEATAITVHDVVQARFRYGYVWPISGDMTLRGRLDRAG